MLIVLSDNILMIMLVVSKRIQTYYLTLNGQRFSVVQESN
jgi:hypothetical protein